VDSAKSNRPIRDWWHRGRPFGCWGSFNGYGCTSLYSEVAFVFGSCRTFFGEPCLKGAPPSPLPPDIWSPNASAAPVTGLLGWPAKAGCANCAQP
jgi:hypothetical protein